MTSPVSKTIRPGVAAISLLLAVPAAHAEVIIHGGQMLSSPAIPATEVPASVGEQKGGNLFHSFSVFNVFGRESVNFTGPGGVKNVVSRVTGGTSAKTGLKSSVINGPVTVDIPGANFYFINPHGVVFGKLGSVHATGSVHISTADMVKLQDGGVFHADPAKTSTLTSAPPSAFGFLGPQAASIKLNGPWIGEPYVPPAPVPPGKTFALVGGDIEIRAGAYGGTGVVAPGANVVLASVASAGDVGLTADGGVDLASLNGVPTLGRISISDGSLIDVGGDTAGSIAIRSGELRLSGSTLQSQSWVGGGAPGSIDIAVGGPVVMSDTSFLDVSGEEAGSISIRGGSLALSGSYILAQTKARKQRGGDVRNGGVVDIQVDGDLTLARSPDTGFLSAIDVLSSSMLGAGPEIRLGVPGTLDLSGESLVLAATKGASDAARLRIEAGTVQVRDLGRLRAESRGDGPGPSLEIAADSLRIFDFGVVGTNNKRAGSGGALSIRAGTLEVRGLGAALVADNNGSGEGASLSIEATSVKILNGGLAGTASFGRGRGGALSIAADSVLLTGTGDLTLSLSTESLGGGAGNLRLDARTLRLRDGARISSSTGGPGDAGAIAINASESLRITGELSGIFSSAARLATGNAGTLNVATPLLAIDGGVIDSSTVGAGNAGDVEVRVADAVLTGGGQIRSFSGGVAYDQNGAPVLVVGTGAAGSVTVEATRSFSASGATSDAAPSGLLAQTRGSGAGGGVRLTTPTLVMTDGALIGADTGGTGDGGNVLVSVANAQLSSGARISSGSGITVRGLDLPAAGGPGGDGGTVRVDAGESIRLTGPGTAIAANTRTSGRGGDVVVQARDLTLENGATLSSSSTGSGLAGDVRIDLGDTLTLRGAGVATQAVTADGGNIRVTVPRLIDLIDSRITTSVESGVGGGGNIFIDPDFLILQRSQIIANAFGGPGGNITIIAGQLIADPASTIEASSALGIDGSVTIDAPNPDVGSNLVVLPESFLDASRLLQPSCGAARAGLSSLVEVGRGGLPPDPDGYLPSTGGAAVTAPLGHDPATGGSAPDAAVFAKVSCTR